MGEIHLVILEEGNFLQTLLSPYAKSNHLKIVTYSPSELDLYKKDFKELVRSEILTVIYDTPESIEAVEILQDLSTHFRPTNFLVISDNATIDKVVSVMSLGAVNCLVYPSNEEILTAVEKGCDNTIASLEKRHRQYMLKQKDFNTEIISQEAALKAFLTKLDASFDTYFPDSTPALPTDEILLVEDEPSIQRYIKRILEEKNYTVKAASSGSEGLGLIESFENLRVILLDDYLPDHKGHQLIPLLKKVHPHAEIIMITAYKDIPVAVKSFSHGIFSYINKPIDERVLLRTISAAIVQSRHTQDIANLTLPYDRCIQLFKSYVGFCLDKSVPIYYKDLPLFFPKISTDPLSEELKIPNGLLKDLSLLYAQLGLPVESIS